MFSKSCCSYSSFTARSGCWQGKHVTPYERAQSCLWSALLYDICKAHEHGHFNIGQAQSFDMQAEHYDRTRQQQVDIGLLAPEEAEAQQPADQVNLVSLPLY